MSVKSFASNTPEFGRTQYFFGAVVLILKPIFLSEGLVSFIYDVIGFLNEPATKPNTHSMKLMEVLLIKI